MNTRDIFSYSLFYENLLRIKNQLLYQRELEVKNLKLKLQSEKDSMLTEVRVLLSFRLRLSLCVCVTSCVVLHSLAGAVPPGGE